MAASSDAVLQKYKYRALRPGSNNIRLLQIQPGTGDEEIFCQVFQYTLRNDLVSGLYEALSYVWGDSENNQKIQLKNAEDAGYSDFEVTGNLHKAMLRLRDPELPRAFWIDAICINQEDLQERATQVQIMARIYAYALSVSVWLGEDADDSSSVFDLCRGILAESLQFTGDWHLTRSARLKEVENALKTFMKRPWFERVWVVQEAAVAQVVSVLCGDAHLPGTIFAAGLQVALTVYNYTADFEQPTPTVLKFMDKSNANFQVLQKLANLDTSSAVPSFSILPLGELLEMFRLYKATDARDRVFALLGLSSDNEHSPNFRPDYTKSWSLLFEEAIRHVLGETLSIMTWEDKQQAVISGPGVLLGILKKGRRKDEITLMSPVTCARHQPGFYSEASWEVPSHSDNIWTGDVLCLLEGARQPTVIRRCGDHYDIIVISLPPPAVVSIEEWPWDKKGEISNHDWVDFLVCLTKFPRTFHLVWDWTNDVSLDLKGHDALYEPEIWGDQTPPTTLERIFHSVRILDELCDRRALLTLLMSRPPHAEIDAMAKHLTLLHHVYGHWEEYQHLKQHYSELQWCHWNLKRSAASESLLLRQFWAARGFTNADLFDIVQVMNKSNIMGELAIKACEQRRWSVGEGSLDDLLTLIAPNYSAPTRLFDGQVQRVSPFNHRYVLKAFLAQYSAVESVSDATYKILVDDNVLQYKHCLFLAILSESGVLDWVPPFKLTVNPSVDWFTLEFLFCEVADNPVSMFHFLQSIAALPRLRLIPYKMFQILKDRTDLVELAVEWSTLCELEISLWLSECGKFRSVLRYLFDMFDNPPAHEKAQLYGSLYGDDGSASDSDESEYEGSAWPDEISTITCKHLWSVKALARFAQKCVLSAVETHKRRLRPKKNRFLYRVQTTIEDWPMDVD